MTLAHLRTKHLLLIACPALAMAVGPDANAARAHVHGQGTLDIVVESGRVHLMLIAPDADIKENADDTPAALEARFGNPDLFTFTGAECQLQSMSAGPAEDLEISWFEDAEDEHDPGEHEHGTHEHSDHEHSDHDHSEHDHSDHDHAEHEHEHDEHAHHEEAAHADTQLSWTFRCSENPGNLTVQLFDQTGLSEIKVQAVGDTGARGATLTADNPELELP